VFCWRQQSLRFVDFYGTPKFRYRIQHCPLVDPAFSQLNVLHTLLFHLFYLNVKTIYPSNPIPTNFQLKFTLKFAPPPRRHNLPRIVFRNVTTLTLTVKWLRSSLLWTFHIAPVNVALLGPTGPTIHLRASGSPLMTIYMVNTCQC